MATTFNTLTQFTPAFAREESELAPVHRLFKNALDAAGVTRAARMLRQTLTTMRNDCRTEAEWRCRVDTEIRPHPVYEIALLDPFIRHANTKPRGYAGDAELLDFIYQHPSARPKLEAAHPAGKASTLYTTNASAPRAVRNRACLLAAEIDAIAARNPQAEFLSLACGHLREAAMSTAIQSKSFGRFLALDQDLESVALVQRENAHYGVQAAEGSVRSVITSRGELGQFDFAYAAGLYDYLNDKVAARLLRALFDGLKPGGKVWVANFMPAIPDRAIMEAIMDWWLIYRDERQMFDLGTALPASEAASMRTFADHEENVVYLEVVRKG